eukprot:s1341_g22.t1
MAVGDEGGFKKVVDPTARVFEYTSCPDEEFAAALEKQMKAEEGGLSRFGALAGALSKLSYHYHMVMPGYIILFIRTFLTLEGIAGVVRPDFNIYEASLPYAMQRALSPKTKAAVAALRQNFVTETGSPQWETLDALVSQAEAETNDSNTADAGHAAHAGAEANSASSSSSSSSSSNYAEVLQRVLASPQGSALRRIFADLDAQQLLQGLAGKKGRPLRDLASNALAERLRRLPVSLRFPWRRPRPAHSAHSATAATAVQALAPTLTAPMAPMAPMAPTTYERRQRERREKSMKIIGGLQLQRFRGRAAAVAIVAWAQLCTALYCSATAVRTVVREPLDTWKENLKKADQVDPTAAARAYRRQHRTREEHERRWRRWMKQRQREINPEVYPSNLGKEPLAFLAAFRMAYACYARMARCRAANLSLWSRRVNFALDSRGLSASIARSLCSEARPALTFPEQRLGVAGPLISELALEASELERRAAVLESLSEMVALLDLLGVTTRWGNEDKDDPDIAAVLGELGQANLDEAKQRLEECLQMLRFLHGNDDPIVIPIQKAQRDRTNIAATLRALGVVARHLGGLEHAKQ